MVKVLVTSDLHLSDKIWKHRPIEGDSYWSWEQIVDIAVEECDAVILAGDILDKQLNNSNPISKLIDGLNRLETAGIQVFYNQGQHEYQTNPWMGLHKLSNHIHRRSFELGGFSFLGFDYGQQQDLAQFLNGEEVKDTDFLVCHQVWLEFMGEECKPQGSFADIPKTVKYLITGDYHDSICQKFGNLVVISPGSTHLRSIAEPEDKFVFVLELDNSKVKITSRELYTRRKIEIDATNSTSSDVLKNIEYSLSTCTEYAETVELPEDIKKPLLRLTYAQANTDLVEKVEKAVNGRAHIFYKQVKSSTGSAEPSLSEHIDAGDRVTLLSCLDNYVDQKTNADVYSLSYQLLQFKDPEQALDKWIKDKND